MTAQSWDLALTRARAIESRDPRIAANIVVLTQLRERWQDSVDMLTSMFDLVIVPSGAGWPSHDGVFVRVDHDQRSGEPVVKVALYRSQGRSRLAKPGGTVLVAGDVARPPRLPLSSKRSCTRLPGQPGLPAGPARSEGYYSERHREQARFLYMAVNKVRTEMSRLGDPGSSPPRSMALL